MTSWKSFNESSLLSSSELLCGRREHLQRGHISCDGDLPIGQGNCTYFQVSGGGLGARALDFVQANLRKEPKNCNVKENQNKMKGE